MVLCIDIFPVKCIFSILIPYKILASVPSVKAAASVSLPVASTPPVTVSLLVIWEEEAGVQLPEATLATNNVLPPFWK